MENQCGFCGNVSIMLPFQNPMCCYSKYGGIYSKVRKNSLYSSLTNINFRAYITTSGIYTEISEVEVLLKLNNFAVFTFDKISALDHVFMCFMITT